jgi:hypothetical protein
MIKLIRLVNHCREVFFVVQLEYLHYGSEQFPDALADCQLHTVFENNLESRGLGCKDESNDTFMYKRTLNI